MSNPLLGAFNTPFELPPFSEIKEKHFVESIDEALDHARSEIEEIIQNPAPPTFENVIEALERSGEKLGRNSSILFNLNSAETNDEIQSIAQEVSPKLTAFSSETKQNPELFKKVKAVHEQRDELALSPEELKLLDNTYKDFVRRGAELTGEKKKRFKEISIELSKLSLKFSENVLAETNAYELIVEDEADLAGLPEDVLARAAGLAKEKGHEGKWMFTLQAPSYIPFMEYADNRSLREQLYHAYLSKCFKGDEHDNQDIIKQVIQLKAELAGLLGYNNFAEYVLEQRMAETPEKVQEFLDFVSIVGGIINPPQPSLNLA